MPRRSKASTSTQLVKQRHPSPPAPVRHSHPSNHHNLTSTAPGKIHTNNFPHPSPSSSHTPSPVSTSPVPSPIPLNQQQPKTSIDANDVPDVRRNSLKLIHHSKPRLDQHRKHSQKQQIDIVEHTLTTSKASCLRKKHHRSSRGVNVGHLLLTNTTLYFQAHYLEVAPKDARISLPLVSITLVRTSSYRRILPYALHVRCRGFPDYLFAFACVRDQLTFRHHLELAIHDANELYGNSTNLDSEIHNSDHENDYENQSPFKDGHIRDTIDSHIAMNGSAKISNSSSDSNSKKLFRMLIRQNREHIRPNSLDTNTTSNSVSTVDERDSKSLPGARSLSRNFPQHNEIDVADTIDHRDDLDDNHLNSNLKSHLTRSISHPGDSTSSLALVTDGQITALKAENYNMDLTKTKYNEPDETNVADPLVVIEDTDDYPNVEEDKMSPTEEKIIAETTINTSINKSSSVGKMERSRLRQASSKSTNENKSISNQTREQKNYSISESFNTQSIATHCSTAIKSIVNNTPFIRKKSKTVTIVTPNSMKKKAFAMDLDSPSLKSHVAHKRSNDALIFLISVVVFLLIVMMLVIAANQVRVRLTILDNELTKHLRT